MHGNVWEWCRDVWQKIVSEKSVTDPVGYTGVGHVYRGGSWEKGGGDARSARRQGSVPSSRNRSLGFRLLLSDS